MHACMYISDDWAYLHAYRQTDIPVYKTHAYMYASIHVCIQHIHVHVYIYTHTHTHTHNTEMHKWQNTQMAERDRERPTDVDMQI